MLKIQLLVVCVGISQSTFGSASKGKAFVFTTAHSIFSQIWKQQLTCANVWWRIVWRKKKTHPVSNRRRWLKKATIFTKVLTLGSTLFVGGQTTQFSQSLLYFYWCEIISSNKSRDISHGTQTYHPDSSHKQFVLRWTNEDSHVRFLIIFFCVWKKLKICLKFIKYDNRDT